MFLPPFAAPSRSFEELLNGSSGRQICPRASAVPGEKDRKKGGKTALSGSFLSECPHPGVDDRIQAPRSAFVAEVFAEVELVDQAVQVGGLEAEEGGGAGHVGGRLG